VAFDQQNFVKILNFGLTVSDKIIPLVSNA